MFRMNLECVKEGEFYGEFVGQFETPIAPRVGETIVVPQPHHLAGWYRVTFVGHQFAPKCRDFRTGFDQFAGLVVKGVNVTPSSDRPKEKDWREAARKVMDQAEKEAKKQTEQQNIVHKNVAELVGDK
jgi:hypothetical protein